MAPTFYEWLSNYSTVQHIIIWFFPMLFAITAHEASHGWVAFQFGDTTAYEAGRVTFNPLKHIDIIGTLVLPIFLVLTIGIVFGWAKPVPVNHRNLFDPKRHMAFVALAGPGANFIMILLWAIVAKISWILIEQFDFSLFFLFYMAMAGILANSILMFLNLLPILPLDGGRIVYSFLPDNAAFWYGKLEPFGLLILIFLLLIGFLGRWLFAAVSWLYIQISILTDLDPLISLFNALMVLLSNN